MKDLDKPNNSELEQSLIGTMMFDSSCIDEALSLVTEKDIYNNNNKVIFKTIKKLYDNGENADLINVTRKIRELGKLEEIGGAYYVTSVTQYSTFSSELFKRCLILKELTARRDLIEASTRSYQRAFDMNQDIFESLEKHDKELMDIRDMESISDNVQTITNMLQDEMVTLTRNMSNPVKIAGLATGFENLDNVLHGLKAGQSICIAARPSQGKSSIAMNICTNIVQNTKKAVLIFSIEMEKRELVLRLMSSESSVEAHRISTGNISVDEFNTIMHTTNKYMDTNLLIDDSGRVTMPKIRNICKKHAKRYGGIELIVVDFLQLIQTDTNSQNREKEISSITRDIKLLAKELSCPVIHLSQLSRKCEDRADKRPILSDLRDSGTIEENSDVVMFVFRPEYYGILQDENGDSTEGKADIIIAKNRGGSVGTIGIKFDGRYTRFSNDTYYQQPTHETNPNRNLEPNRDDNQF
jgi:replicative DNA helicase